MEKVLKLKIYFFLCKAVVFFVVAVPALFLWLSPAASTTVVNP